ncbi:hypothetical protein ES708_04397 [subsurface metagenome]
MDSGVVSLVHRGSDSTLLQTLLGARMAQFTTSNEPLAKAIITLTLAAKDAASLHDDPQRWRMYHQRGVPVLPPRCALDRPVTVDLTAVTVREVLHEFLRLQPGGVLLVYDEADNQEPENEARRRAEVIFTSISPERRRIALNSLVRCLDPTYEPLHGYATKAVRGNDAQRELSRRKICPGASARAYGFQKTAPKSPLKPPPKSYPQSPAFISVSPRRPRVPGPRRGCRGTRGAAGRAGKAARPIQGNPTLMFPGARGEAQTACQSGWPLGNKFPGNFWPSDLTIGVFGVYYPCVCEGAVGIRPFLVLGYQLRTIEACP